MDHAKILEKLKQAQDVEHDMREKAREADLFTSKRDGQWEQTWWDLNDGKPRYTFDVTTPIVEQIAGEIEKANFGIEVDPAGGNATEDLAQTISGLIRNIQNISDSDDVYNDAARAMVNSGIAGWRVVQKYLDNDSFDQDLVIEAIPNFKDRVWFNDGAEEKAAEDARLCFVMQAMPKDEYDERWPEGTKKSVEIDKSRNAYFNVPDTVIVGEVYYFKEKPRELVLMSNGKVYPDDENFKKVRDELAELGVTEKDRRKVAKKVVYTRKFDGDGWLEDEKETVFTNLIPVVPLYGNFKIIENKVTYRGVVEKVMDAQRVLNYSLSREVEEGALAPRKKYWMTKAQATGHQEKLSTLNTNSDPVQFYEHDPDVPGPPQQTGGAEINPGLRSISTAMTEIVSQVASLFAANMGDNPNAQSGVAIQKLQDKGDIGTTTYYSALERAITKTGRILIDAIPEVYTPGRQVRILDEDGTSEMITLGQEVIDRQTGQTVILNDLSVGKYDISCSSGPSFQSKQQQTVSAILEVAGVDPSIIQGGGDILLNNIDAPGMKQLAERKRAQLFAAGQIPVNQMTDEEKQVFAQQQQMAQQNPPQDPMLVAAQAELIKAQNEQVDTQVKAQVDTGKLQLEQQKQNREDAKFQQGVQNDQIDRMIKLQELQQSQNESIIDEIHKQAQTLKLIREAMGAAGVISPEMIEALNEQAGQVIDSQLDNQ